MKILIDTYKNTGELHHAYLFEGEVNATREALFSFLKNSLKTEVQGNPDFSHNQFDSLTIDDARALREAQSNKALGTNKKIFVIETRTITIEAQNSLLKVLEEPTAGTHIFIIMPSVEVLLPTLRSRVQLIASTENSEKNKIVKDFLVSSVADRLKMVGEIVESKDKGLAIQLVDWLIQEFHSKKNSDPKILKELLHVRGYLNDRSPSLKLLLEHTSLIV